MILKNFSRRILLSITGRTEEQWRTNLAEVEKRRLKKVALFLEFYNKEERQKIYLAINKSRIKTIPLVHIKDDMDYEELVFLKKRFKTKCFNIHESHFNHLPRWKDFSKYIYLEMNYDNDIPKNVDMKKIGGFCIDLSHFMAAKARKAAEYQFVLSYKDRKDLFLCNHLNGYDPKEKKDVHTVKSFKDFDYLKELPEFVFGKYIAIETFNYIPEQIKFKKYLVKMLNKQFKVWF